MVHKGITLCLGACVRVSVCLRVCLRESARERERYRRGSVALNMFVCVC